MRIARCSADNVILTPYSAFYSVEALEESHIKCATDVAPRAVGRHAGLSGEYGVRGRELFGEDRVGRVRGGRWRA